MVIITTLWNGIVNAIKFGDPTKNFMDKIVIDVTNPFDFSKDILPKLAISHIDSAGEGYYFHTLSVLDFRLT